MSSARPLKGGAKRVLVTKTTASANGASNSGSATSKLKASRVPPKTAKRTAENRPAPPVKAIVPFTPTPNSRRPAPSSKLFPSLPVAAPTSLPQEPSTPTAKTRSCFTSTPATPTTPTTPSGNFSSFATSTPTLGLASPGQQRRLSLSLSLFSDSAPSTPQSMFSKRLTPRSAQSLRNSTIGLTRPSTPSSTQQRASKTAAPMRRGTTRTSAAARTTEIRPASLKITKHSSSTATAMSRR